jgi:hypothetical protein
MNEMHIIMLVVCILNSRRIITQIARLVIYQDELLSSPLGSGMMLE